jgi:hypothetical protein
MPAMQLRNFCRRADPLTNVCILNAEPPEMVLKYRNIK